MVEPLVNQILQEDRREREYGRRTLGQLSVDLGRQGLCFLPIAPNGSADLPALSVIDPVLTPTLIYCDPTDAPAPRAVRP